MTNSLTAWTRRFHVLAAVVAVLAGATAHAQQYEAAFGGTAIDVADGGVLSTADGGAITVGRAQSFHNPANEYDVYVVKSDRCGVLQWSRTYDFGGWDFGRKIRSATDGGYLIVGSTENTRGCHQSDILLMKIDANGNALWSRTYGGDGDDNGYDVAIFPGGARYAVVGSTTSYGAGGKDAFVMVTDNVGVPTWGRAMGSTGDDYFYGCMTIGAGLGEIVAVGGTDSYGGNINVYGARLDAGTGATIWTASYGGGSDEVGYCVILGPGVPTDYVIAGYTNSGTGTYVNQALILRLLDNGGVVAAHHYGANNSDDDFREIRYDAPRGQYWAVGTLGALRGGDLYLARINATTYARQIDLAYGGNLNEQGWSCALVTSVTPPHVLAAGFAQSFGFGSFDAYLIRTNNAGLVGCTEVSPLVADGVQNIGRGNAPTCDNFVRVSCKVSPVAVSNTNGVRFCPTCPPAGGAQTKGREESIAPVRPDVAPHIRERHIENR